MKAAVIKSVGEVGIETVDDPTPGRGEVGGRRSRRVGLCGTDLHILQGEFAPSLPHHPGPRVRRDGRGDGPDVDDVGDGDRVAVDPSLYCYECHYCRLGKNNLCLRWGAIGVTAPGGAAEYVAVPAANCVALPESVATADATLIEPLSCAVRGYDVLRSQLGSHVLIYGAGTMGLMMLRLAKRVGAAQRGHRRREPRPAQARRASWAAQRTAGNADEIELPYGWELVVDATGNDEGHPGRPRPGRPGRHVPAVRRRRLRRSGDDRPVPHLQQGDHHHRLDGGAAQLRAGGGTVRRRRPRSRRCSSPTGSRSSGTPTRSTPSKAAPA